MNEEQRNVMASGRGFIAALDQSGGSTPKALKLYGIAEDAYKGDEQMFDLIHQMRERLMSRDRKSTRLNSSHRSLSRMPSSA